MAKQNIYETNYIAVIVAVNKSLRQKTTKKEIWRNEMIFKWQGTRNWFIDNSGLSAFITRVTAAFNIMSLQVNKRL